MIPELLRRLSVFLCLLAALAGHPHAGEVLGEDFNQDEDRDYRNQPKLRLSVETGFAHWFYDPNLASQSYQNYVDQLENGWSHSAQIAYFPWEKGGIGAEWIWFLSKANGEGVTLDSAGVGPRHSMRDRMSFIYYGPTFLSRLQFERFGMIVGSFGAGLLLVHYTWTDNGRPNLMEAKTYAIVTEVGWEYSFFRSLAAGLNARVLLSNLKEYTLNGKKVTIKQPDDENYWINIFLNRFELSAGLRFGL